MKVEFRILHIRDVVGFLHLFPLVIGPLRVRRVGSPGVGNRLYQIHAKSTPLDEIDLSQSPLRRHAA